jgi:hypothetical protein
MRTGRIKYVYLALMGVVLSSCDHPSGTQVTEARIALVTEARSAAQVNVRATIACVYFQKTMNEVSKGLLANSELEQRIGSVYENARLATLNSGAAKPPDDFGPSAEEMLRSIIENNHKSFVSAADRFSKACKSQSF